MDRNCITFELPPPGKPSHNSQTDYLNNYECEPRAISAAADLLLDWVQAGKRRQLVHAAHVFTALFCQKKEYKKISILLWCHT